MSVYKHAGLDDAPPTGRGSDHVTLSEGLPKSKETLHTYLEVHVVGESKYGITLSTEEGIFAPVAVM